MSATPAAELARVKIRFPAWTIRPVQRGTGYTAHQGRYPAGRRVYAPTLAELERDLAGKRRR